MRISLLEALLVMVKSFIQMFFRGKVGFGAHVIWVPQTLVA